MDQADRPQAVRSEGPGRWLDLLERAAMVGALLLFYAANYASHRVLNLLVVASDGLTIWFMLFRRPASAMSRRGEDWLVAFVGTLSVLFMRPGGAPLLATQYATGLILSGFALTLWAKLSLNRSFGIAPANRGVQVRGAYALVRHPMYLSYLLLHGGYVLINPTPLNAGLFTLSSSCQIARVLFEERLLKFDPAYQDYARKVRFRLVPGFF